MIALVAVTWMADTEDLCNIEGDGDGDGRNSSGVSSSTSGKGKIRDFTVPHMKLFKAFDCSELVYEEFRTPSSVPNC